MHRSRGGYSSPQPSLVEGETQGSGDDEGRDAMEEIRPGLHGNRRGGSTRMCRCGVGGARWRRIPPDPVAAGGAWRWESHGGGGMPGSTLAVALGTWEEGGGRLRRSHPGRWPDGGGRREVEEDPDGSGGRRAVVGGGTIGSGGYRSGGRWLDVRSGGSMRQW